ncbi:MAG: hypothetical protein Q8Q02_08295 [Nocardioides sp.]|nr:hypothetical protein [Nocardioides sp.]
MAKRTVHLHIGPPGPASDAIHDGVLHHRFALAAAGFHVPATSAYEALTVEADLLRTHKDHGLRRKDVEGTWARTVRHAWRSKRDVVLSVPGLAAAPSEVVALTLDALAWFEVHLVVTPADPGTALTYAWSAAVHGGRGTSFTKFCRRLLDEDRTHDQARAFWAAYDLEAVLRTWAGTLDPSRVHVVTTPSGVPGQAPGGTAWHRFGRLLGADLPALDLREPPRRPTDDGEAPGEQDARERAAQVAVLRRVNRALDGRLAHPAYHGVVAPLFGDVGILGLPDLGPDPRTAPLGALLDGVAERWATHLTERGHPVHGDLADLRSATEMPAAPHPDEVPAKVQLEVAADRLAEALVEVARLRRENERLGAAATPAGARARRS